MASRSKIFVSALAAVGLAAVAVGGQYAGAALFAKMQHLPPSVIGIFTLRDYWHAYGDVPAVKKALAACSFVSVAIPVGAIAAVCFAAFGTAKRELHGSARFAKAHEIRKTGLLDNEDGKPALIIGKYRGKYLTFPGQQFVMLAAPTRSGKGVAVAIPNLLTYPDSMVVLDLKLENYKYTSAYRQKYGQMVFLWAPFAEDGKSHGWNVFDSIAHRPEHLRIGDVQAIGLKFYPTNVEAKTKFWNDLARNLFVGLSLYLMETATKERYCTLGEIFRQSSGMGKPIKEHIAQLRATKGLSEACTGALNRFLSSGDEVLSSILSTFNAPLLIFDNPIVDAATSHSSFDINEVRRQRMTIYIGIQPNRLEDAALLVNLFFSQLIDLNTSVLPEHDASLKYQCTLVLDEFTAIGRVNIIDTSNAFIAGFDLRLLTIIQAVSQMERPSLYGKEGTRTLVVNHAAKVLYPPKDHQEAKDLSDALGYFTETSVSKNRTPGKPRGENHSDQKRALMMPQELEEMGQDEEILLGFGKPIRCKKAFYYNDPVFVDRLKEMSPLLRALGEDLPTETQLKAAAGANELCTSDVPIIDPVEWQAKRQAATAARRADGTRVARATDLIAMRDAEVSVALAAALAEGVYADLLELTGMQFNFADTGSQASALGGARSPIQEEMTHG